MIGEGRGEEHDEERRDPRTTKRMRRSLSCSGLARRSMSSADIRCAGLVVNAHSALIESGTLSSSALRVKPARENALDAVHFHGDGARRQSGDLAIAAASMSSSATRSPGGRAREAPDSRSSRSRAGSRRRIGASGGRRQAVGFFERGELEPAQRTQRVTCEPPCCAPPGNQVRCEQRPSYGKRPPEREMDVLQQVAAGVGVGLVGVRQALEPVSNALAFPDRGRPGGTPVPASCR